MKKMGYCMIATGVVGAGIITYCLVNKDTKRNADKLLNTVMSEADQRLKKIM